MKVPAQTVLITGATSGIGRATALAFARSGANVALIGRDAERGRTTANECESAGARALFIQADLVVPEELRAAVIQTCERFVGLDVASTTPACKSGGGIPHPIHKI